MLLKSTTLPGPAVGLKNRQHLGVDYVFQKLDSDANGSLDASEPDKLRNVV